MTISALAIPHSPQPTARGLADASAIASLAAAQYGEPNKSNFPTIDGVLKPNLLFQMTVSGSHEVNIDGLIAAVTALQLQSTDPPPRLYFVVPPQQFATYQVGAFVTSKVTPLSALPKTIEYWILQLYSQSAAPSKRKTLASSTSPPPSPKAVATYRTLPVAPLGHTTTCSCKGPCRTSACSCKAANTHCHSGCHSTLAKQLKDPLHCHKNCANPTA